MLMAHTRLDSMTLNCTRDLNGLFFRQIANAFEIETKECLILYVNYVAIYFSNMFQLSTFSKYSSESGLPGHTIIQACHDVVQLKILKSGHFCTLIYFVHG